MNYLAHIALSGANPQHQVGGLLGDFYRGPTKGQFPAAIEIGIIAHRKLDAYVDRQQEFHCFLQRFEKPLRRYAGIVADIIYDHILACEWHQYYAIPLDKFCHNFYAELANFEPLLPPGAKKFLHHAPSVGWLESYRDVNNLPLILQRVGQRFNKPIALEAALPIYFEHKDSITSEFHRLYPRLQAFIHSIVKEIELH